MEIQNVGKRLQNPIRVLQFGEGVFLRAFADQMIDTANKKQIFNGNIIAVKPRKGGDLSRFSKQNSFYTVCLRGKENGEVTAKAQLIESLEQVISAYDDYDAFMETASIPTLEFVISNTTEAGITFSKEDLFTMNPPLTFPAKLTKWLYTRFCYFGGSKESGIILLPTELIENNGDALKKCILKYCDLWNLENKFIQWLENSCTFCSTLVDRIVSGYPSDAEDRFTEIGYTDLLLDVAEPFGCWIIENKGDVAQRFSLDKAGLPVSFVNDITPYRERKVRILNGAHTGTAMAGYLAGADTVGECMNDPVIRAYMVSMMKNELSPVPGLSKEQTDEFIAQVIERFENPFLRHSLLSISLNSVSKWKARILPSFKDYVAVSSSLPVFLTFSFAALVLFYTHSIPERSGYEIKDDPTVLDFFAAHKNDPIPKLVKALASQISFWGKDLSLIDGFTEKVSAYTELILEKGMKKAMEEITASQHNKEQ